MHDRNMVCTKQSHGLPQSGIDRSPQTVASTAVKRTGEDRMHRRHGSGPDLQRQLQSGCARAGSERNSYRIGTIAWTHFALTSLRPGHTRVSPLLQRTKGSQPDGPDMHPPRQSFGTTRRIRRVAESHLGSTLKPGGAVLTGGVFRRSGSVAYVRADASPSEVLAHP